MNHCPSFVYREAKGQRWPTTAPHSFCEGLALWCQDRLLLSNHSISIFENFTNICFTYTNYFSNITPQGLACTLCIENIDAAVTLLLSKCQHLWLNYLQPFTYTKEVSPSPVRAWAPQKYISNFDIQSDVEKELKIWDLNMCNVSLNIRVTLNSSCRFYMFPLSHLKNSILWCKTNCNNHGN